MQARPGGFFRRALAFALDLIIIDLLYAGLALVGSAATGIGLKALRLQYLSDAWAGSLIGFFLVLWFILFCAYFIYFGGYGGQTPGKMAFKLRVVSWNHEPAGWGRVILRTLGYFVSVFFLFGVGFLIALIHPNKRALHDLLAGTAVVQQS